MEDVDVLIIGGGAQGLWLLNDLDNRGFKTILLERRKLGCGQTCHSHALIQRGHYYDNVNMMKRLNHAAQLWQKFINDRGINKLNQHNALTGFTSHTDLERYEEFWKRADLPYGRLTQQPEILRGGKVLHLVATEEISLDARQVVQALANDVMHCIYKIDDNDEALAFHTHTNRRKIEGVTAVINGESYNLSPKMTVICAGENNLSLLEKIEVYRNPEARGDFVQARWKHHMLMIRGKDLPPLTVHFPWRSHLGGVLICSRVHPSTGDVVWLVSNHRSYSFNAGFGGRGKLDPAPERKWIRDILESLPDVIPKFRDLRDGLRFAVYTGLASERDVGTREHVTDFYIEQLSLENALTIWPTKLTLTPYASEEAVSIIDRKIPSPSGNWHSLGSGLRGECPVSIETWQQRPFRRETSEKTAWKTFPDFIEEWEEEEAVY